MKYFCEKYFLEHSRIEQTFADNQRHTTLFIFTSKIRSLHWTTHKSVMNFPEPAIKPRLDDVHDENGPEKVAVFAWNVAIFGDFPTRASIFAKSAGTADINRRTFTTYMCIFLCIHICTCMGGFFLSRRRRVSFWKTLNREADTVGAHAQCYRKCLCRGILRSRSHSKCMWVCAK